MLPVPSSFSRPPMRVFQPLGSRKSPRPRRAKHRVCKGGRSRPALPARMSDFDLLHLTDVRQLPRLRTVGDVTIGQNHDRSHANRVAIRPASTATSKQSAGLRAATTASGTRRGDHREPSASRLAQSWSATSTRSTALDVDYEQRQLKHDGQAETFAFKRDPWPTAGRYSHCRRQMHRR
jgi:hypothetical protein